MKTMLIGLLAAASCSAATYRLETRGASMPPIIPSKSVATVPSVNPAQP